MDERKTVNSIEPGINFIETHLNSAEIAIFFHILEAGIIYQKHPEERGYLKREGMIRLHLRIQDTRTGKILHTANLTGKLTDTVRKQFKNQLASFHYKFAPNTHPIQDPEKNK